jgi:acetamidase/formamidase
MHATGARLTLLTSGSFSVSRQVSILLRPVADCRVTQFVDVRKGVHCMVPKSVFMKKK